MPAQLPADIERKLEYVKASGDQWMARCPCHMDNQASLALKMVGDQLLVRCHAGCDSIAILAELGWRGPDRGGSTAEWTPKGDATAVYTYVDAHGQVIYEVLRTADKDFSQRRPDPSKPKGWAWNLQGVSRLPYRLPDLIAAVDDGKTIYIVEGEKDVETMFAHGFVATCNSGGAGKWVAEFGEYMAGAKVIIIADKDDPGRKHAREVAQSLDGKATEVWIMEAPDPHKDVSNLLQSGGTIRDLEITTRPEFAPKVQLAETFRQLHDSDDPPYDWLVEGLLERCDRLILTGFEGHGKSMLIRQLAVGFSVGLHPFTSVEIEPIKVLYVDCENTRRQTRRNTRGMDRFVNAKGKRAQTENLRILYRGDMNLLDMDDVAWLNERVTAHAPDLLIIGPLYKLHIDSPNDETVARQIVGALDQVRLRHQVAIITEAHAGHGEWGKNRSTRPAGSSLYMRWPEFGMGLKPEDEQPDPNTVTEMQLVAWRGARDEREWPRKLSRGPAGADSWPWVVPMALGAQRAPMPEVIQDEVQPDPEEIQGELDWGVETDDVQDAS
jgi:hypothetical protein